jgi:hypothetical protein
MKKLIPFLFFLLIIPFLSHSQTSTVKGVITDENNKPVEGVTVRLQETKDTATTDKTGAFIISNIPYGDYMLGVSAVNYVFFTQPVKADQATIDLGNVSIHHEDVRTEDDNIPVVSLSESDLKESSTENVSSALGASRDAFTSAATFAFSGARYRIRGYDDENFVTLMNGSPMNDLTTGRTMYNTWSGLNDVTHNRETSLGLAPAYYSYGGIGGAYNIDTRASVQRKQLQVSYALSNRSYDDRVMATYGTGLLKNGWSFAGSFSRRWANEGYVKGTYYDGFSYFGTVEKFINDQHSLSFTAFASPTKNGRATSSTQEMYDLAGTNYYNPNWGFQDGKVRNAVVGNTNEPAFILTHEWKIDGKSSLLTAASYVTGKSKVSGLDWFNATDPRPDYYRNLPSYIATNGDSLGAIEAAALLSSSEEIRQIKWDALYAANQLYDTTIFNVDGIAGNNVTGKRASYIVQNRVSAVKNLSFNTVYNNTIGDNTTLTAGFTYQKQQTEYYKEVNDLLGADFFVDYNQYALQDFPNDSNALQNDLNHPNRVLHVGDKYGYDYVAHISKAGGWWQTTFKFNHIDFFFASQISDTKFYREGKVRNGLFPDDSYGNSPTQTFINLGGKGGLTYKVNGRNYLFANVAFENDAPDFYDSYVSAQTRQDLATDLKSEEISSVEGGYLFKSPKINGRAVLYYTQVNNATQTKSYYDENYSTFVNYTLTNLDKRYTGSELSIQGNLGQGFSANAVASIGQYIYSDRPLATVTVDNSATVQIENQVIYLKNYHLANSPEKAYTAGLTYRAKQFWSVNFNVNYFDGVWIDVNTDRRTEDGIALIDPSSDLFKQTVDQEKAPGEMTMDVSGSKSWRLNGKIIKGLKKPTFLLLNVGVNNLLNNKKFITNGYEYSRYSHYGILETGVNNFASKYSYAYGTTFFVSLTLRMN